MLNPSQKGGGCAEKTEWGWGSWIDFLDDPVILENGKVMTDTGLDGSFSYDAGSAESIPIFPAGGRAGFRRSDHRRANADYSILTTVGYDGVTGLGTPNISALIDSISGAAAATNRK